MHKRLYYWRFFFIIVVTIGCAPEKPCFNIYINTIRSITFIINPYMSLSSENSSLTHSHEHENKIQFFAGVIKFSSPPLIFPLSQVAVFGFQRPWVFHSRMGRIDGSFIRFTRVSKIIIIITCAIGFICWYRKLQRVYCENKLQQLSAKLKNSL